MTREDFERMTFEEYVYYERKHEEEIKKHLEAVIEKNKLIADLEEEVACLREEIGINYRDIEDLKKRLVKSNKWAMRMQKKLKEMGVEDDE